MNETERSRNDWIVVLLFLLLGILFMLLAGQKGTQLLPTWNLRVDLGSNLDPNNYQVAFSPDGLPPLRPEILTPPAWGDKFLTPHPDQPSKATPPTFVVFDPSATPSATPSVTASPTTTTTTTPPTPTATWTRKPPDEDPPTPTATASATASPTGYPDTLDPTAVAEISPTPDGFNPGPPDGSNNDGDFPDNSYFLVDIAPIVVGATPDDDYELVYYDNPTVVSGTPVVLMDNVIVGITNAALWTSYTYYEVFNWYDNIPDSNTNVDYTELSPPPDPEDPEVLPESDNSAVLQSQLYNNAGVLIDVEGAASEPPPGSYDMLVVIAPDTPDTTGDDSGQVDSIEVLADDEVLLPP